MKLKYLANQLIVAVLLCLLAVPATAQTSQDNIVKLVVPEEMTVYPGTSNKVRIAIEVRKGYHLQANPVNDPFLIPTSVEMRACSGELQVGKIDYPSGHAFRLQGAPETMPVYDGLVIIEIPLEIDAVAPAGEYLLRGKLNYQACDYRSCLAPAELVFSIPVFVE